MSRTKIEWTNYPRPDGTLMPGYSFNGWWGCVEAGPECDNCYARTFAHRLGQELWGHDAPRRFFGDKHWDEPRRWDRRAAKLGEKHLVFCQSMSDVLEDRRDLDAPRARLWELIEATPNLVWLLLTKRPSKYSTLTPARWQEAGWPRNVWAGTTAGTQRTWDVNVRQLAEAAAGAAMRWVSIEPLLEPLIAAPLLGQAIQWVIVGSESGGRTRPTDVAWIRLILRQCDDAGVRAFIKQVATPEGRRAGDVQGLDPSFWPADVRIRQFPRIPA